MKLGRWVEQLKGLLFVISTFAFRPSLAGGHHAVLPDIVVLGALMESSAFLSAWESSIGMLLPGYIQTVLNLQGWPISCRYLLTTNSSSGTQRYSR